MMKIYAKDNYFLRRFNVGDWLIYKDIRLEALRTEPQVFGSNFDKEATYTPDDWKAVLTNENRAFFGLFHDNDLIGMTGIVRHHDDASQAALVASYIRPEHRRLGLSALFYEARLDWARENNFARITVSHRASNTASKAANQRFGFKHTHSVSKLWPDGVEAEQAFYALDLSKD